MPARKSTTSCWKFISRKSAKSLVPPATTWGWNRYISSSARPLKPSKHSSVLKNLIKRHTMPLSKFGRKPTARLPISNSSRMPRHKLVICLLLLLALATGFQIPFAGVSAAAPAIRSGEVLVKFRGSANPVKILLDPNQNITEVVARYQQFSGVEYVEPNATFQANV